MRQPDYYYEFYQKVFTLNMFPYRPLYIADDKLFYTSYPQINLYTEYKKSIDYPIYHPGFILEGTLMNEQPYTVFPLWDEISTRFRTYTSKPALYKVYMRCFIKPRTTKTGKLLPPLTKTHWLRALHPNIGGAGQQLYFLQTDLSLTHPRKGQINGLFDMEVHGGILLETVKEWYTKYENSGRDEKPEYINSVKWIDLSSEQKNFAEHRINLNVELRLKGII